MKNSLFCISLFALTCALLPMDAPLNQQTRKTKRGRLLFSQDSIMGDHIDCIAFLDEHHLMIGKPSQSMIVDLRTRSTMSCDISANHLVSYPQQKLIVVTNFKGVGIYQISLQDEQKISEKCFKKKTEKEVFSGRSFLFCGGKYLVTGKETKKKNEIKNKIKIYSYKDGEIGKSLRSKRLDRVGSIGSYTGPNNISESLFFYQEKGYSSTSIGIVELQKKILKSDVFTCPNDHSIKYLAVGPKGESIAFLMGIECIVLKGERFNKPISMISQTHHHQFAVMFYTHSLLARLVFPDHPFMSDYRKLKIEFCDISTKNVVFSKIIKSIPKEGIWYAETPSGLWGNPSEIIFSPDRSKYAVLWNNSVFVYTVPMRLCLQSPQFRMAFVNQMLMVHRLPLCPDLLSCIICFLFSLYRS